jgi:hypothetical protein
MMGAGSGGSADASSQEVAQSLTNLFNIYAQVEVIYWYVLIMSIDEPESEARD